MALAILIEAVERVLAIAMLIFTDPCRTMSAADCAHGVEGFAGDGDCPSYTTNPHFGQTSCSAPRRS